jgi:hypothetical protein
MPCKYPITFREDMIHRMLGGESVLGLVKESDVPEQTLHRWKHEDYVDSGFVDGVTSSGNSALRAAHKRIKTLEKELQPVKDTSEIYDSLAVVDPKGGRPSRRNS